MTAPDPFGSVLEAIAAVVARRVAEELRPLFGAVRISSNPTALLDKRALAQALAVSAATIARMTAEGMPHVFVGASPRYALDEVRAWLLERGRQGTTAKPSKRHAIPGVRLLSRRAK